MKKTIILIILFFSTPSVLFAAEEAEKSPNVSFIFSEFFIQILATLFLIWLIKKFAWKNFQETLEARRDKINGDIENAEEAKMNAQTLEEQRLNELNEINSKKKDIMKTTISKAQEEEKLIISDAKTKSKDLLEKAKEEAQQEKASVKEDLSKELANVSLDLVRKFMFEEITEEQEQKLLKEAALKVGSE